MASVKFSATSTASAATSISVSLGGSPASGDLVLVFLLVDNEIVTHQPGYSSEFTNTPNPWFKLDSLRSPDSATLGGWYHTWNASDSGSSVTFTFSAAPTLGVGDKDLSTANAVAVAVVLNGASASAVLEHNIYGLWTDVASTIAAQALKKAATLSFHCAATNGSTASLSDSDGSASLVQQVTLSTSAGGLSMAVFSASSTAAGYKPTFTLSSGRQSLLAHACSVSDTLPQLYNPPYIEEAPMADNVLHYRYRLNRFFTVLNNSGTFSAKRYLSTDDLNAATQTFVNNQAITSTDRTNILAAGVGGDFLAQS